MPTKLRLCSWNIFFGLGLPLIKRQIQNQVDFKSVDLLGLQETATHSKISDSQIIAQKLGPSYKNFQIDSISHGGQSQGEGFVWNSDKVKIDKTDRLVLPMRTEAPLSKWEQKVFRNQKPYPRIAIIAEGQVEKKSIRVYVVHLNLLGFGLKSAQLDFLLADTNKRARVDFTIIMGDFNSVRFNWTKFPDYIKSKTDDAKFKELTSGIKSSHFLGKNQKLDAIFIKTRKKFLSKSWHLPIWGSDHFPIFSDLTI